MTPAEKQEVIWMFLDQGLTKKEIAERTGIPYGTVYMHAKRKREHDEADMTGDNSDRHKCRTCQYRHSDAGGCDYCIHTGRERGCDVEVCDKAVVGERLTKHLEWGWSKKTVDAIEMGIHALKETQWIPISERLPEEEEYILLSFANYTGLDIGRYEKDGENDNFYPVDKEETYASYGLIVNAWMPLPEPYREEE